MLNPMHGRDSGILLALIGIAVTCVLAVSLSQGAQGAQAGGTSAAMYPNLKLTPGVINADITQANISQNLCNKNWSTKSERDQTTSAAQKATTYQTYGIPHPKNNTGANQTCELDHLISLELGGADTLKNIWPECGPAGVPLNQRYFKEKDSVENYLHAQVCAGKISLNAAQVAIVTNWYAVYVQIKGGNGKAGAVLNTSDPDDTH